jgi:murein DD-endopeptidase MepM/ murein hydrolase activator NlpD
MKRLLFFILFGLYIAFIAGCSSVASYGIYHKVRKGDTLYSIARRYHVSVDKLMEGNSIPDAQSLQVGDWVFVPGATQPVSKQAPSQVKSQKRASSTPKNTQNKSSKPIVATEKPHSKFAWPMKGVVTSPFGKRWGRMHEGIDIGAPKGTPVYASAAGKVIFAGNRGAYGKVIIIQHPGNWFTVYAHNSKIVVSQGETVKQGQLISKEGQTGRATGPHLHFEIRKGAKPLNPLSFLP